MDSEVNDALPEKGTTSSGTGKAQVKAVVRHNWIEGQLKMKVKWSTKQLSWEELSDMKEDHTCVTAAQHLVDAEVKFRLQRGD